MKTIELADAEKLEDAGYILYRMLNPATVGSKKFMSFVVQVHPGVVNKGPGLAFTHFPLFFAAPYFQG